MRTNPTLTIVEEREQKFQSLRFSVLAEDVATVGSGTLFAAIFNTLLVFLIPRLVRIEDFGYWRLFLLYASYAGLLHLGLADGALLRWAGKPLEEFHHQVGLTLKVLFWQHLAFIVPAGLLVALWLPRPLGLVGVAILVVALMIASMYLGRIFLRVNRLSALALAPRL
jgi:hypothetical protein